MQAVLNVKYSSCGLICDRQTKRRSFVLYTEDDDEGWLQAGVLSSCIIFPGCAPYSHGGS